MEVVHVWYRTLETTVKYKEETEAIKISSTQLLRFSLINHFSPPWSQVDVSLKSSSSYHSLAFDQVTLSLSLLNCKMGIPTLLAHCEK